MLEWCNNNAGFIAALQTLATVFLSIVAIVVAAYGAWLPYKKELRIYSGLNYGKDGNYTMELFLYNSGNVPLYVKYIELLREFPNGETDILALGALYSADAASFLAPKMAKDFSISMENCNAADEKGDCKIKIVVTTEEKEFVERVGWAVG